MTVVILNGGQIRDRRDLHEQLRRVLELPDWYGGNLDGLMDCLTQPDMDRVLQVIGFDALERRLGHGYARGLRQVLLDAQLENPRFRVEWDQ